MVALPVDLDEELGRWPRPTLRLVAPSTDDDGVEAAEAAPGPKDSDQRPWAVEPCETSTFAPLVRSQGVDVALRRRRRATRRLRRRRLTVGTFVAATAVALALPVSTLGGRPSAASATGELRPGATYVVQSGDTLWDMATRLDPTGDPRVLVAQLEEETGSDAVVPGEHLRLP
jgi:nucleoid-associated protein YgaU